MTDRRRRKTKRSIKQKGKTYYHFYKRNGAYDFLKKNVLKLVVGLGGLALILYLVKDYLPDLDYYFELMTIKFRPITILLIFLLSESFLGLIPPDFFILWGKQFQNPYAMVGLLAALSYGGGVISYIIGVYIGKLPKVHNWLERKFLNHIDNLRKWGGVLIVFAALFGTFVPLALESRKIDPALATGPFITTMNDVIGLLIYFLISEYMFL